MNRRPKRSSRLLWSILALAAIVILGTSLCCHYLVGRVNYLNSETIDIISQEKLDACQSTEYLSLTASSASLKGLQTQGSKAQCGIVNILLIGQDRREGEARARSDTMILCSFNKEKKTLTLTSFLRDLYVAIPGHRNNRLNAAYTAGGMKLLQNTLETNFGITIHGNMEVDFSRFSRIVDLLGGVTIHLRQDEAEEINQCTSENLSAGNQLLDGNQALAYVRIRKLDSDGDFSRTERQRKLLQALFDRYRTAGPGTIFSLLKEILPMVTTDLTQRELLQLAVQLVPMLTEMEIISQHIPAEGTYSYKTIRNMIVLAADMDAARELLAQTVSESTG